MVTLKEAQSARLYVSAYNSQAWSLINQMYETHREGYWHEEGDQHCEICEAYKILSDSRTEVIFREVQIQVFLDQQNTCSIDEDSKQ